jgi:hypothetical protein
MCIDYVITRIIWAILCAKYVEGRRQPYFSHNTLRDFLVASGKERRRRGISSDGFRRTEVVQVVAPATAKSSDQRKRLTPPAGASDPLLIIESLRGHICLIHRLKCTDIDSYLHRCCHGQQINFFCTTPKLFSWRVFLRDKDTFEGA